MCSVTVPHWTYLASVSIFDSATLHMVFFGHVGQKCTEQRYFCFGFIPERRARLITAATLCSCYSMDVDFSHIWVPPVWNVLVELNAFLIMRLCMYLERKNDFQIRISESQLPWVLVSMHPYLTVCVTVAAAGWRRHPSSQSHPPASPRGSKDMWDCPPENPSLR